MSEPMTMAYRTSKDGIVWSDWWSLRPPESDGAPYEATWRPGDRYIQAKALTPHGWQISKIASWDVDWTKEGVW